MSYKTIIEGAKQVLVLKSFCAGTEVSIDKKDQAARMMRFILLSIGILLVSVEPSIAYAGPTTTTTTAGGLEKMVTNIVGVLTGTFGKGIATIAIMAMGIMAMFGKLEWASAVKVIIGIAVTFGAASIVKWLTGGTSFDAITYLTLPISYLA